MAGKKEAPPDEYRRRKVVPELVNIDDYPLLAKALKEKAEAEKKKETEDEK